MELQSDVRSHEEWGDTFTTDDLNAFFIENLGPGGRLTDSLRGFHSPRVALKATGSFLACGTAKAFGVRLFGWN